MKNRRVLIGIVVGLLVVLLFIALIFVFCNNSKDYKTESNNFIRYEGEYTEPDFGDVSSDTLSQNHCDDNICFSIIKIVCNESKGTIYYKISNVGNELKKSGYYKINFNNDTIYLSYNNLNVNESNTSTNTYYDVDLTKITDFNFTLISDKEGKKHVIQE